MICVAAYKDKLRHVDANLSPRYANHFTVAVPRSVGRFVLLLCDAFDRVPKMHLI